MRNYRYHCNFYGIIGEVYAFSPTGAQQKFGEYKEIPKDKWNEISVYRLPNVFISI